MLKNILFVIRYSEKEFFWKGLKNIMKIKRNVISVLNKVMQKPFANQQNRTMQNPDPNQNYPKY